MHPEPSRHNPPSTLPIDIDEIVHSALSAHNVPGCSVAVTHGSQEWTGAYGLARTSPPMPFFPDTRIPIASMTKPFTATAVMALVEEGKLELDVPVRTYLPEFRVADSEVSRRVTIRHLLTHRVGWLGDETELGSERGDGALAAQVAGFASLPQVIPLGTTFSYANTAWDLAGRVVEVVEGECYESVIERRILVPLGMGATTFFAERVVSAPAASGHAKGRDGDPPAPVQDAWLLPRGANPSGGLISTAGDLLTWMRWWLGRLDGDVA
ncbi:serine hydrolase domain-containing protein, partial [Phytoactinopolyspora endophytica]|uniref:serine hydrolase domain-containing protein n=1 Tax=Phytoactinopolyspora endophytica TaxID=1642495 RepID=UPI0013EADDAE